MTAQSDLIEARPQRSLLKQLGVDCQGPVPAVIPAFNIPYLPMMEPVVAALRASGVFGLIAVARLEWIKFEAGSLKAISSEYQRVKDERFTHLHLDHVPVIDEDNLTIDVQSLKRSNGFLDGPLNVGFFIERRHHHRNHSRLRSVHPARRRLRAGGL